MLNSNNVVAGQDALATQYNNLRLDLLLNAGNFAETTADNPNEYEIDIDSEYTEYVDGSVFKVRFHEGNTDAVTINVNQLGAKDLVKAGGGGIGNAEIAPDAIYYLMYNEAIDAVQIIGSIGGGAGGFRQLSNPVYDEIDMLVSVDLDGVTHTLTYDDGNNLQTVNDGTATYTISRDEGELLTSITF